MDTLNELNHLKLPPSFASIPFGIKVLGNDHKKIILLIWNHNTVVTYTFRDINEEFLAKSLDNFNLLEPNQMHEIKDFLEHPNETIVNIFDTKINTFLLTSHGNLFVFTSNTTLKKLTFCNSANKVIVKHLGYNGTGIYLIENRNANEIFIKFYSNETIAGHKFGDANDQPIEFNLNIEENLKFSFNRLDEKCCIKSFKFDKQLHNILESLIGTKLNETIVYTEIVLFSIESNLFWLNTANEENLIQPLNVAASKILNFNYSKSQNCIICVLASGVVEILYMLTKFNMINKYYYTMHASTLTCCKFIDSNNLIYSNANSGCIQVSFYNDKDDCDGIDIESKPFNVYGAQAFAYNKLLNQIFIITNNFQLFNINYSTNYFQLSQNPSGTNNFSLGEVKNFARLLFTRSEQIKNLEARKNQEMDKIKLIDLIKWLKSDKTTSIHESNTCRINLIYHGNSALQFQCTFNVHLKIVENFEQFKILVKLQKFDNTTCHMFDVESRINFKRTIDMAAVDDDDDLILPKFKIQLVSRFQIGDDGLAYEFPMRILNNYYDDIDRNYFYLDYNKRTVADGRREPCIHKFRIKNVDLVGLEMLAKRLELDYSDGYCEYLFLNRFKFKLNFANGLGTIEAGSAHILYCVKYYVVKRLNANGVEFDEGVSAAVQKLKYALPEDEEITQESRPELIRVLQNLRNEFIPTFKIAENQ